MKPRFLILASLVLQTEYMIVLFYFQPLSSVFQERDMYQTSYSFSHRPFASSEMQAASHWNKDLKKLPWWAQLLFGHAKRVWKGCSVGPGAREYKESN